MNLRSTPSSGLAAIRSDSDSLTAVPGGPKTILIVEDDPLARMTEAQYLRLEGYHVLTATDVASGLRVLETRSPDAILLDLKLPGAADGLDFLRELRRRGDATPTAVVTGHYAIDDSTESEIRQLDAVIAFKPLWNENVLTLARDLTDQGIGRDVPAK
jgi:DNA-binding response OmpR family regulator